MKSDASQWIQMFPIISSSVTVSILSRLELLTAFFHELVAGGRVVEHERHRPSRTWVWLRAYIVGASDSFLTQVRKFLSRKMHLPSGSTAEAEAGLLMSPSLVWHHPRSDGSPCLSLLPFTHSMLWLLFSQYNMVLKNYVV